VQRLRGMLCRRDREEGVRQSAAARRATRGLDHRVGAGIDADHERVRALRGDGKNMSAVTGPEIDRHPGVAFCEASELADVELVEATAFDHAEHVVSVHGATNVASCSHAQQ
jgi:hypothetical protein